MAYDGSSAFTGAAIQRTFAPGSRRDIHRLSTFCFWAWRRSNVEEDSGSTTLSNKILVTPAPAGFTPTPAASSIGSMGCPGLSTYIVWSVQRSPAITPGNTFANCGDLTIPRIVRILSVAWLSDPHTTLTFSLVFLPTSHVARRDTKPAVGRGVNIPAWSPRAQQ